MEIDCLPASSGFLTQKATGFSYEENGHLVARIVSSPLLDVKVLIKFFCLCKQYFLLKNVKKTHSIDVSLLISAADPLEHVAQMFREYMLEKSLFSLVNPAKNKEGPSQSAEVLLYTQLLTDSATSTTKSVSLPGGGISTTKGSLQHARIYIFNTVHYNLRLSAVKENCFVLLTYVLLHVTGGDELGQWWSAIITVAINWLAGDEENAEAQYPMCDSFPQKLQQSE